MAIDPQSGAALKTEPLARMIMFDDLVTGLSSRRAGAAVTTAPGAGADGAQQAAGRYAWYVIGVLMLAYAFAFLDRQILALMVEPIKRDLGISDFRMSLLLGLALRSSTRCSASRSRVLPTARTGAT